MPATRRDLKGIACPGPMLSSYHVLVQIFDLLWDGEPLSKATVTNKRHFVACYFWLMSFVGGFKLVSLSVIF